MYVLSFSGFLRNAELLELRHSDIMFQSDHTEIHISRSKTDQLRQGDLLAIAKSGGQLALSSRVAIRSYFAKANIPADSKNFIFRPISASKKQKKLAASEKHISYSTYPESLKSAFKGIVR